MRLSNLWMSEKLLTDIWSPTDQGNHEIDSGDLPQAATPVKMIRVAVCFWAFCNTSRAAS
jgi:hypothetical protein